MDNIKRVESPRVVVRPVLDVGMPLCGGNPLWQEVQTLTAERNRLLDGVESIILELHEVQGAYTGIESVDKAISETRERFGDLRAFREAANERDELRSQLETARARADAFQQEANRLRAQARRVTPRPFLCPYCGLAVTDTQYHEGPEDCRRERVLLGDDTDSRG